MKRFSAHGWNRFFLQGSNCPQLGPTTAGKILWERKGERRTANPSPQPNSELALATNCGVAQYMSDFCASAAKIQCPKSAKARPRYGCELADFRSQRVARGRLGGDFPKSTCTHKMDIRDFGSRSTHVGDLCGEWVVAIPKGFSSSPAAILNSIGYFAMPVKSSCAAIRFVSPS